MGRRVSISAFDLRTILQKAHLRACERGDEQVVQYASTIETLYKVLMPSLNAGKEYNMSWKQFKMVCTVAKVDWLRYIVMTIDIPLTGWKD